jgi:hypothetical protein
MKAVKAIYDGNNIKVIENVRIKKNSEFLIILPEEDTKMTSEEARDLLRACAKGENLTQQLLHSRKKDLYFEK